jgi:hypothetical protein
MAEFRPVGGYINKIYLLNQAVNKRTTCYSTSKYLTVSQDVFKISVNLPQ